MEYSHGIIYWNIVMEYSHGIQSWNYILEYSHGIQSWNYILEYSHGIYSWNYILEYSHGIQSWNYILEHSHGIQSWNYILEYYYDARTMNIKKKDEILSSENPTVIENLEDQGLNGRVILKWDTKKQNGRLWRRLIWIRAGPYRGLFSTQVPERLVNFVGKLATLGIS